MRPAIEYAWQGGPPIIKSIVLDSDNFFKPGKNSFLFLMPLIILMFFVYRILLLSLAHYYISIL